MLFVINTLCIDRIRFLFGIDAKILQDTAVYDHDTRLIAAVFFLCLAKVLISMVYRFATRDPYCGGVCYDILRVLYYLLCGYISTVVHLVLYVEYVKFTVWDVVVYGISYFLAYHLLSYLFSRSIRRIRFDYDHLFVNAVSFSVEFFTKTMVLACGITAFTVSRSTVDSAEMLITYPLHTLSNLFGVFLGARAFMFLFSAGGDNKEKTQ